MQSPTSYLTNSPAATVENFGKKNSDLYDFTCLNYFILDANGAIIEVSSAGAELLGIKKNTLINKCFFRYVAPNSHHRFLEYYRMMLKEKTEKTCTIELIKKKGGIFNVFIKAKPTVTLKLEENKILMIVIDITNKFDPDHYNHKMIPSELSSLVSHEINQPLAIILNYVNGCIRLLKNNDYDVGKLLQAMYKISTQLKRTEDIILQMNNFICTGNINRQLICPNALLEETIELIKYETVGFSIKINYRRQKSIPKMLLDKFQIQLVILNIARNAVDAMRDNNIDEPSLIIEINQLNKKWIEIIVSDNGPGVAYELTHKLFAAHFTTKSYGTGLGLAISRSIVSAHGGELIVDNSSLYGGCFKLTLPITPN